MSNQESEYRPISVDRSVSLPETFFGVPRSWGLPLLPIFCLIAFFTAVLMDLGWMAVIGVGLAYVSIMSTLIGLTAKNPFIQAGVWFSLFSYFPVACYRQTKFPGVRRGFRRYNSQDRKVETCLMFRPKSSETLDQQRAKHLPKLIAEK